MLKLPTIIALIFAIPLTPIRAEMIQNPILTTFTAIADTASAGFYNPAGLIQLRGVKIFGMNKINNRNNYIHDPKCIAFSFRDTAFFWGNTITLGSEQNADFNYYSIARQIHSHVAIGGSLKFRRRRFVDFYQFFGYETSYDLGILIQAKPNLKISAIFQNLPDQTGFNIFVGGLAWRIRNFILAIDLAIPPKINVGVEFSSIETINFRFGNFDKNWSIGSGIQFRSVKINYSYVFYKDQIESHFLSAEISI